MGNCLTGGTPADGQPPDNRARKGEGVPGWAPAASGGPDAAVIDEVIGPLFQLSLEARYGQAACQAVFIQLCRLARLCSSVQPNSDEFTTRLGRLRDVCWGVEELFDHFSSRGWMLRLLHSSRLDALVRQRLDDVTELITELEGPAGQADPAAAEANAEVAKQLAAGLKNAYKLQEAVSHHLPSITAAHGGAADANAMEAFVDRVAPHIKNADDPAMRAEIVEEAQIAAAAMSVGPHRAIRHPDLQLFWWRHMEGAEEVEWAAMWPALSAFLARATCLSDRAGDVQAIQEMLNSEDTRAALQSALHRMGYTNRLTAAELDMGFAPWQDLDQQLRWLAAGAGGRPALLGRSSWAAGAAGWAAEAEARAAREGAARSSWDGVRGMRAAGREGAGVKEAEGEEEDAHEEWFDARSGFSRASSSCYMSIMGALPEGDPREPLSLALSSPATGPAATAATPGNLTPLALPSRVSVDAAGPNPGPVPDPRNASPPGTTHTTPLADRTGSSGAAAANDQDYSTPFAAAAIAAATASKSAAVHPGCKRLVGRDADLQRLLRALQPGVSSNLSPGIVQFGPLEAQRPPPLQLLQPSNSPALSPPRAMLLAGPAGCGKSALLTAACNRLVHGGTWHRAAHADLRCCGSVEEAALALCLALEVPFYAADRPAGSRLLGWLRRHGPRLGRQGLVLDGVDLVMGLGRDYALDAAHAAPQAHASTTFAGGLLPSLAASSPSHGHDPSPLGGAASARPSTDDLHAAGPGAPPPPPRPPPTPPPSQPASAAAERRGRLLRLLRDVLAAAPGLQVVMVAGQALTAELLEPAMPTQGLSVAMLTLGPLEPEAAVQMLSTTITADTSTSGSGRTSRPSQGGSGPGQRQGGPAGAGNREMLQQVAEACGWLPGLMRLAGAGVRCGVVELGMLGAAAEVAISRSREMGAPQAAVTAFEQHLVSHSVACLPPDARAVLCAAASLGVPLEEEEVGGAADFLGSPGLVRAALCTLYDRGVLSFQDLSQRHEVCSHVAGWLLRGGTSLLHPVVHGSRAPPLTRSLGPRLLPTPGGGSGTGGGAAGGGAAGGSASGAAPAGAGVARNVSMGRAGSGSGAQAAGSGTQGMRAYGSNTAKESGIRLRALVDHLDNLLTQAGQLYASGCRVSALRLYNNSRTLADRSLLLLPAWLARAGPSSATAAVLAASLTRHLNTICRHVLLPHQLARLTRDLAHLVPQLPSGLERLTSHVTTARSSTHLLSLPQAAHELQAATVLAQQLFPVVAAATRVPGDIAGSEAEGCSGRENGEPGSASGAVSKGQGGKGKGRAEDGQANGAGEAAVGRLVFRQADVAGLQPQVAALLLAHAELAAAFQRPTDAAALLFRFLDLLSAASLNTTPDFATARLQLGDVLLRLGCSPLEAAVQYEAAVAVLTRLHGQAHFRVGRAMLAAARCSQELQAAQRQQQLIGQQGSGGQEGGQQGGAGVRQVRVGSLGKRQAEPLLAECLKAHEQSQGKFNLDVAEVEVARGVLLLSRGSPPRRASAGATPAPAAASPSSQPPPPATAGEALDALLRALGIVLEVLGDGNQQVAEILDLVARALQQQDRTAAAAAIAQHAQALRTHAAAAAAATHVAGASGSDGSATTAHSLPNPTQLRPTEAVVHQHLLVPHLGVAAAAAAAAGAAAGWGSVSPEAAGGMSRKRSRSVGSRLAAAAGGGAGSGTPRAALSPLPHQHLTPPQPPVFPQPAAAAGTEKSPPDAPSTTAAAVGQSQADGQPAALPALAPVAASAGAVAAVSAVGNGSGGAGGSGMSGRHLHRPPPLATVDAFGYGSAAAAGSAGLASGVGTATAAAPAPAAGTVTRGPVPLPSPPAQPADSPLPEGLMSYDRDSGGGRSSAGASPAAGAVVAAAAATGVAAAAMAGQAELPADDLPSAAARPLGMASPTSTFAATAGSPGAGDASAEGPAAPASTPCAHPPPQSPLPSTVHTPACGHVIAARPEEGTPLSLPVPPTMGTGHAGSSAGDPSHEPQGVPDGALLAATTVALSSSAPGHSDAADGTHTHTASHETQSTAGADEAAVEEEPYTPPAATLATSAAPSSDVSPDVRLPPPPDGSTAANSAAVSTCASLSSPPPSFRRPPSACESNCQPPMGPPDDTHDLPATSAGGIVAQLEDAGPTAEKSTLGTAAPEVAVGFLAEGQSSVHQASSPPPGPRTAARSLTWSEPQSPLGQHQQPQEGSAAGAAGGAPGLDAPPAGATLGSAGGHSVEAAAGPGEVSAEALLEGLRRECGAPKADIADGVRSFLELKARTLRQSAGGIAAHAGDAEDGTPLHEAPKGPCVGLAAVGAVGQADDGQGEAVTAGSGGSAATECVMSEAEAVPAAVLPLAAAAVVANQVHSADRAAGGRAAEAAAGPTAVVPMAAVAEVAGEAGPADGAAGGHAAEAPPVVHGSPVASQVPQAQVAPAGAEPAAEGGAEQRAAGLQGLASAALEAAEGAAGAEGRLPDVASAAAGPGESQAAVDPLGAATTAESALAFLDAEAAVHVPSEGAAKECLVTEGVAPEHQPPVAAVAGTGSAGGAAGGYAAEASLEANGRAAEASLAAAQEGPQARAAFGVDPAAEGGVEQQAAGLECSASAATEAARAGAGAEGPLLQVSTGAAAALDTAEGGAQVQLPEVATGGAAAAAAAARAAVEVAPAAAAAAAPTAAALDAAEPAAQALLPEVAPAAAAALDAAGDGAQVLLPEGALVAAAAQVAAEPLGVAATADGALASLSVTGVETPAAGIAEEGGSRDTVSAEAMSRHRGMVMDEGAWGLGGALEASRTALGGDASGNEDQRTRSRPQGCGLPAAGETAAETAGVAAEATPASTAAEEAAAAVAPEDVVVRVEGGGELPTFGAVLGGAAERRDAVPAQQQGGGEPGTHAVAADGDRNSAAQVHGSEAAEAAESGGDGRGSPGVEPPVDGTAAEVGIVAVLSPADGAAGGRAAEAAAGPTAVVPMAAVTEVAGEAGPADGAAGGHAAEAPPAGPGSLLAEQDVQATAVLGAKLAAEGGAEQQAAALPGSVSAATEAAGASAGAEGLLPAAATAAAAASAAAAAEAQDAAEPLDAATTVGSAPASLGGEASVATPAACAAQGGGLLADAAAESQSSHRRAGVLEDEGVAGLNETGVSVCGVSTSPSMDEGARRSPQAVSCGLPEADETAAVAEAATPSTAAAEAADIELKAAAVAPEDVVIGVESGGELPGVTLGQVRPPAGQQGAGERESHAAAAKGDQPIDVQADGFDAAEATKSGGDGRGSHAVESLGDGAAAATAAAAGGVADRGAVSVQGLHGDSGAALMDASHAQGLGADVASSRGVGDGAEDGARQGHGSKEQGAEGEGIEAWNSSTVGLRSKPSEAHEEQQDVRHSLVQPAPQELAVEGAMEGDRDQPVARDGQGRHGVQPVVDGAGAAADATASGDGGVVIGLEVQGQGGAAQEGGVEPSRATGAATTAAAAAAPAAAACQVRGGEGEGMVERDSSAVAAKVEPPAAYEVQREGRVSVAQPGAEGLEEGGGVEAGAGAVLAGVGQEAPSAQGQLKAAAAPEAATLAAAAGPAVLLKQAGAGWGGAVAAGDAAEQQEPGAPVPAALAAVASTAVLPQRAGAGSVDGAAAGFCTEQQQPGEPISGASPVIECAVTEAATVAADAAAAASSPQPAVASAAPALPAAASETVPARSQAAEESLPSPPPSAPRSRLPSATGSARTSGDGTSGRIPFPPPSHTPTSNPAASRIPRPPSTPTANLLATDGVKTPSRPTGPERMSPSVLISPVAAAAASAAATAGAAAGSTPRKGSSRWAAGSVGSPESPAISSPAARQAGSYTAALLERQRRQRNEQHTSALRHRSETVSGARVIAPVVANGSGIGGAGAGSGGGAVSAAGSGGGAAAADRGSGSITPGGVTEVACLPKGVAQHNPLFHTPCSTRLSATGEYEYGSEDEGATSGRVDTSGRAALHGGESAGGALGHVGAGAGVQGETADTADSGGGKLAAGVQGAAGRPAGAPGAVGPLPKSVGLRSANGIRAGLGRRAPADGKGTAGGAGAGAARATPGGGQGAAGRGLRSLGASVPKRSTKPGNAK